MQTTHKLLLYLLMLWICVIVFILARNLEIKNIQQEQLIATHMDGL